MRNSIILTTLLSLPISFVNAQQAADGAIVPFTSVLPACASLCGKLWDVQGACVLTSTEQSCFCADSRLTPFLQGTSGVSSVCGAASCTAAADLTAIENWYKSYCGTSGAAATTTGSGSQSTGTSSGSSSSSTGKSASSGPKNTTWLGTHYRWVIMIVVLVVGIPAVWVAAFLLRRRYIRKKEREFEMRPPVAWGPHQMQATTGGYRYGDGVVDGSKGGHHNDAGGHHKEASRVEAVATPANAKRSKRESKGWLTKSRQ